MARLKALLCAFTAAIFLLTAPLYAQAPQTPTVAVRAGKLFDSKAGRMLTTESDKDKFHAHLSQFGKSNWIRVVIPLE